MDKNKNYYLASVIILILLISAYFIWKDIRKTRQSRLSENRNPNIQNTAPTPTVVINNLGNMPSPTESRKAPPALPFPVTVKAELSEESKKMALEKIESLTNKLKNNPYDEELWLELGLERKLIGDYIGAKEAWEYSIYLKPNAFVPYNNLGDLYTYNFIDYKKAEEIYLSGLRVDPGAVILYEKLYDLYRFRLKNDQKAKSILELGIQRNPDSSGPLKAILKEWQG